MVMKGKRLLPLSVLLFVVLVSFVQIVLARDNNQVRDNFSSQQVQSQKDPSETIPPRPRTDAAIQANNFFWFAFNNGRYDLIDQVLEALVGAYLNDPGDALTAGFIGTTHLWRLSEQSRLAEIPATITDSIVLGRKYLKRSVDLYPNAILLGQLGALTMAEGQIDTNDALSKDGLNKLMRSVKDWPEFNLFTPGYLFSRMLPPEDENFQKGLEMWWEDYEICVGEKVDRSNPDFTPFLSREVHTGRKRVCWNNEKAPHNLEGWFMNMGDMLVKAGDWSTARKIYANARVIPSYSTWKFKGELEERINDVQLNINRFNAAPDGSNGEYKPVMSASPYACAVCHQK